MEDIAVSVRDSEPGTLIYAVHEYHKAPEPPVLVIWEKYLAQAPPFPSDYLVQAISLTQHGKTVRYASREAQAVHRQNPKLAELVRQNSAETLIARPFEIMALTPVGGKFP
jgi:quinol monooxygenase YgiN